jgi:hypothetical protein
VTPPYSILSRPSFSSRFRHWFAFCREMPESAPISSCVNLEVRRQIRIENGIEQRGDRAGETGGGIQRPAIFQQRDELAETFVELAHQETVESHAVFKQPEEGAAVHHRQTCVAQRHHVVAPGLVLEHGAFAEPCPGGETCKTGGLAATGHDAHSGETGHDAGPIFEIVATHEDEFIGAIGFLDDPGARDLDLPFIQLARPGRDALEVIRSNHVSIDRRLPDQSHILRRNKSTEPPPGRSIEEPKARRAAKKFTDQLSGTRHFSVSLCPIESHLASCGSSPDGRGRRTEEEMLEIRRMCQAPCGARH